MGGSRNILNSVECTDVPPGLLLKKSATTYFGQFGRISKITIRPKRKCCIVEYNTEKEANTAVNSGGVFEGEVFDINMFTPTEKKKERIHKDPDPDWALDPEVQRELLAMGKIGGHRTYFTRPEKMSVDVEEPLKREIVRKERRPKVEPKLLKPLTTMKSRTKPTKSQISNEQMEYMKIMKQPAHNLEDKLKILDARDKFIRLRMKKRFELSESSHTVGTCPDMCPEKERVMREVQHQVAFYEQEGIGRTMNQRLAVKQYSRSSADQESPLPHDLRPVAVLQMTMGYLMHRIIPMCDNSEVNLADWYHFLWDRTRSIRKDITQQELCSPGAVQLVEQCARFHVHCSARLVDSDSATFDQKINTENLTKCLQTLKYMYNDLRLQRPDDDDAEDAYCPNEAEFRGYVILLNLNDGNFMWEVQQLSSKIQKSPEVQFALQIHSSIDKNNYVKFFKLVQSTTYLNACILLRYFNQVRIRALRTILKCYSPRSPHSYFPIAELQRILAFEGYDSTMDFLEYHGLELNEPRSAVLLDRRMFEMPDVSYMLDRATNVIESKRYHCVGTVICGKELPKPEFETHEPQDSFKGLYLDLTDFGEDLTDSAQQDTVSDDIYDKEEVIPIPKKSQENIFSISSRSTSPVTNIFGQEGKSIFGQTITRDIFSSKSTDSTDATANFIPIANDNSLPLPPKTFGGFSFKFTESEDVVQKQRIEQEQLEQQRKQRLEEERLERLRKEELRLEVERQEVERQDELRLLNEERERIIELLRVHEVQKKELRLKKLQEERLRREERVRREAKQREQRIKEQLRLQEEKRKNEELDRCISDLVSDLITDVEELLNAERLGEIAKNLKDAKMRLFLQHWRKKASRNKRKRKSMDFQPVFVSHKTMQEEVNELHTTSQALTLSLIKRYKYGHSIELNVNEEVAIDKINMCTLVGDILVNKQCNSFMERSIYWKVGISSPDRSEMNVGWDRVEKTLQKLFCFEKNLLLAKTKHRQIPFSYCIEKSPTKSISDNNGLIFIGDIVDSVFYNRVLNIVKDLRIKSNIPAVVILQKKSVNDEQISNLLTVSCVSNFKVIVGDFARVSLIGLVEEALIFLACNLQKSPQLEIDFLSTFMDQHLVSELWRRVKNFSNWNYNYKKCLLVPNVVIKLHNEAIDRLKAIIFSKSTSSHRDFPIHFQENKLIHFTDILPNSVPCGYRYFPKCWRDQTYRKMTLDLLDSFKLPLYNMTWPPSDNVQMEKDILKYLCIVFNCAQTEKTFLKVLGVILKYLDPETQFTNINTVLWTDVVEMIILEKMEMTNFIPNKTNYSMDETFNEYFVVYETNELKEFSTGSWFYLNNAVIQSEITKSSADLLHDSLIADEFDEYSDEEIEIDFDETLADADVTLDKVNTQLKINISDDRQNKIKNLRALMADLEESMKIQKQISAKVELNLKNALQN